MAFPLIALAATVLPELVRLVAGDRAGTVATAVEQAVQAATGTADPVDAKRRLDEDPAAAAALRTRLAEIAVEQERLQLEAAEKRRAADLAELQTRIADTQGARAAMLQLSGNRDPMRWGAPVVSVTVTLMFVLALFIFTSSESFIAQGNREMVNIILGALVAAFTAVINFWIGSSQGSREKDATVRALQETQAQQANTALSAQSQQARDAMASQTQQAKDAIVSMKQMVEVARAPAAPAAADAAPQPRSQAFDRAVALILENEGGFSNDPRDRGGMTNFGITARTYADFHGLALESVDEATMRALTREQAIEIYRSNYWNAACCDRLPPGLDLCIFDFGVNAGVRRAILLLQELVGVTQDGSVGAITLAAAAACDPVELIERYAERRLAYYRSLPNFDAFGRGWTLRTTRMRDAAMQMARARQPAMA
ncbi:MAG: glycosyl hydrolase 108 family protein [Paracraurococcus sp.]